MTFSTTFTLAAMALMFDGTATHIDNAPGIKVAYFGEGPPCLGAKFAQQLETSSVYLCQVLVPAQTPGIKVAYCGGGPPCPLGKVCRQLEHSSVYLCQAPIIALDTMYCKVDSDCNNGKKYSTGIG